MTKLNPVCTEPLNARPIALSLHCIFPDLCLCIHVNNRVRGGNEEYTLFGILKIQVICCRDHFTTNYLRLPWKCFYANLCTSTPPFFKPAT